MNNIMDDRRAQNGELLTGYSSILGTREYQQDFGYLYTSADEALLAVCDGMGGLEGGERASRTAAGQLAEDFAALQNRDDIPGFFQQTAQRMNRAVRALKNSRGERLKGGTTLVAAYVRDGNVYWVSVGDSRIWLVRGDQIAAVNRDHNYRLSLKMQLQNGMIDQATYDSEERTPQAEALISFLGIEELKLVDGNRRPIALEPGDILILASDGVYKSLSDSQVLALARDNDLDMDIASDRITAMALRYGVRGQDNTTAVMMKYMGKS